MPKGSPGVARKSMRDKMESKIERVSESGCWIWMGKVQIRIDKSDGYGMVIRPLAKRQEYAHRVSWELANGAIPAGVEICHRCDVRLCVNPDHMFLGTRKANLEDASRKGRMLRKLTNPERDEMRSLRATGMTLVALGARFGICHSGVSRHVRGIRKDGLS